MGHGEQGFTAAFQNGIRQILLGFLHLDDALLNSARSDQLEDGHLTCLTDPVRAVGGLVLRGQIPPRIIMDDDIRADQVQAGAACFQGDQEDGGVADIEVMHQLQTFFLGGGTGQDVMGNAGIPHYILTGSTPKEERLQLVHDFNVGDTPVFLISLKAGGTGLNLVGADVVIHYDPWWNLAAQNQATDRAHRIGQTRQVTVFKLIAAGTIEERIVQMQEAKKDLADAILEGRSESLLSMSHDELLALLS